jgi:lipid-binding SYLF domain-containing protein
LLLTGALAAQAQETTPDKRLRSAADVFREVMATPDKAIPRTLLDKAQCVVIVPGMKKVAFGVGGEYGKGFAVCRQGGRWGAPDPVALSGGSFGFQLGADSTDVIMLVMNDRGLQHLISDKFAIGADAEAAAGPVGRDAKADTDITLKAEILSWSRTRGLFAGLALNGTVVAHDKGETEKLYGHEITGKELVTGGMKAPAAADVLIKELDRSSSRRG